MYEKLKSMIESRNAHYEKLNDDVHRLESLVNEQSNDLEIAFFQNFYGIIKLICTQKTYLL